MITLICTECNGTGKIQGFTSEYECEKCNKTGIVEIKEIDNNSSWKLDTTKIDWNNAITICGGGDEFFADLIEEPIQKNQKRVGKFKISGEYLRSAVHNDSKFLEILFSQGVIITNTDHDCYKDIVTYTGIYEKFDMVEQGLIIPLYQILFTYSDGSYSFEFKRVD